MAYFITGGTGFIGRFFIQKLMQREGHIYVLTRPNSLHKLETLRESVGDDSGRIVAIHGDLTQPQLGVSAADIETLKGEVKHLCHFAAVYDIAASMEDQQRTNVEGTRNVVQFAASVKAGCLHHVSSIAAGGLYHGTFREDMFEEAENLSHAYFSTKHDSEGIVRKECMVPWRVYRPSMVMGHSKSGEIDKIDGAYYFFKSIQKLRNTLPQWLPLLGIEGGRFNVVPVDYVVDAMDHIVHRDDLEAQCFHLTDPQHYSMGELVNVFATAGHAPRFSMRLDTRMFGFIPKMVRDTLTGIKPVKRVVKAVLDDMGLPESAMMFVNYPTRYDNRETERALRNSGITVPELNDYAPALWDYWERKLDPDLFIDRSLEGNVRGKRILITGASSGIGKAAALRLAEAGAHLLLVARDTVKLDETAKEITACGGTSSQFSADVSSMEDCDRLVSEVLASGESVDILINNAGRSIRRSLELSYDRFHDFERTMQVNYFGAIRLIMGLLPSMVERGSGQVINISSISTLMPSPRFSAYVASKSALDAWTRAAAVEFSDRNLRFTTINMPLVRTPMISATTVYDSMPVLSTDEATDLIVEAVIHRPKRIATRLGIGMQVLNSLAPKVTEVVMNTVFRMFNDSAAARGEETREKVEVSSEQVALAAIMKGVHF